MQIRTPLAVLFAVLLLAAGLSPTRAAGKKVALLPAPVVKGAADNGPAVTDALRASLERHGFTLVAADRVADELKAERIDPATPQTVGTLSKLRSALGADYLVYPRVLSVGRPFNSEAVQANILVNVVGSSSSSFFHTRQVGKTFAPNGAASDEAVIDRASAERAASQLMSAFYRKAR